MARTAYIATLAASFGLALAAGCVDSTPVSPRRAIGPATAGPLKTIEDDGSQLLGVQIIGLGRVPINTMELYSASVQGGQGPYYYDWFQSDCPEDGCSPLLPLGGGWGRDTISAFVNQFDFNIHLVVHVYDSQGVPFAGSYEKLIIPTIAPSGTPPSDFSCDLGEHYYPIVDFDGKYYRRDGCTGARDPSPTGNQNGW